MQNNNRLVRAGILVAPLFIGLSLLGAVVSPGFSLMKHQVSLLLAGPVSWLQILNFIITGLLGLAAALGLRQTLRSGKAATWGPILFGVYGVFLIVAALSHPDPQLGFPAGAPADVPVPQSAASNMHATAFSLLAVAIIASGFVFARRFAALKERGWRIYSIANSIAIILLVILGNMLTPGGHGGLPLFGVAVCISVWVSAISWHVMRTTRPAGGSA